MIAPPGWYNIHSCKQIQQLLETKKVGAPICRWLDPQRHFSACFKLAPIGILQFNWFKKVTTCLPFFARPNNMMSTDSQLIHFEWKNHIDRKLNNELFEIKIPWAQENIHQQSDMVLPTNTIRYRLKYEGVGQFFWNSFPCTKLWRNFYDEACRLLAFVHLPIKQLSNRDKTEKRTCTFLLSCNSI